MKKEIKQSNILIIYSITFLVAFCSIAYELLLAHTISLVAASTVVWYGIVIGVFLGSLGIGSFLMERLLKRSKEYALLLQIELILTFVGGIVAILVFFAHNIDIFMITRGFIGAGAIIFIGLSLMAVIVVGLLSGIELPLLMKIGKKLADKNISNRVLSVDYFGSLFGSIIFPIIMIPNMNVIMIGFSLACVNFVAAFMILFFFQEKIPFKTVYIFPNIILTIFIVSGFVFAPIFDMYFAKKYYYYLASSQSIKSLLMPLSEAPDIKRYKSPYQIIDFVQLSEKSFYEDYIDFYIDSKCKSDTPHGDLEMYLNGDWQLNIRTEKVYHEFFAHIPIQLSGSVPKKILVLGGGDGMLNRELLKYDGVEKIVHVDLDQKIIDLASEGVLAELNENALADERVEVVVADGYSFVKNSKELFDAIYIDFPTPVDYNLARLYSTEFYSFIGKRLSNSGFVAYDTPGMKSVLQFNENGELFFSQESLILTSHYETIKHSGFSTIIPFVSAIEPDNEKAILVTKNRLIKKQDKINEQQNKNTKNTYLIHKKAQQDAEESVRGFSDGILEGFIFATKNETIISKEYEDRKIPLCFLNEQRFTLSMQVPFEPAPKSSRKNINSIMRPVLPLSKFSQVRLPYYLD